MTKICSGLWALVGGLCLAFSGSVLAAAPPPIPVSVTSVSGLPGSMVQPAFSLAVTGFDFESFDLTLSYADPVLTFDLGSSRIVVNGVSLAWGALPGFASVGPSVTGDVATFQISSFSASSEAFTSPLVLRPAFVVRNAAPLGGTMVSVTGSVGTQPLVGERYFDSTGTVTVTAVPEPEIWLMWLGGMGLLALRRARLQR